MRAHRGECLDGMEHHRLARERDVLLGNSVPDARALPGGEHESEYFWHGGIRWRAPLYWRHGSAPIRFALLTCLAFGCEEAPKPVAPIAESGELVVLTVNGPSTYFEDAQGLPSGLEYDLVTMFAKELNAKARFVVVPQSRAPSTHILRKHKAHLAAAALPRHFDFPGGLAWGPSYLSTQHQVVCREETKAKKLDELTGKRIGVIEESVADYLLTEPSKLTVPIERLGPGDLDRGPARESRARARSTARSSSRTRFTLARRFFSGARSRVQRGQARSTTRGSSRPWTRSASSPRPFPSSSASARTGP